MSDTKRIRVLTVIFPLREDVHVADKPRNITINGVKESRVITNIELVGKIYELYISVGAESRHWKDVPQSERVIIEYYIE